MNSSHTQFAMNSKGEEDPGEQEAGLGRVQEQGQEGQGHAAAAAGEFEFGGKFQKHKWESFKCSNIRLDRIC